MLASHGATLAHFISKEHVLHYGDFVPRNKSTIWYLNHKFTHSASNSRSPTSVGGWIADSARQLNASNANRHPLNWKHTALTTHAQAPQPKQSGWRVGNKLRG